VVLLLEEILGDFVPVGGKTRQGKALLKRIRAIIN